MKSMVSWVMTWPGTMIGKPGGYGITKLAETRSGPAFRRRSISGSERGMNSQPGRVIRRIEAAADIAFVGLGARIAPEAGVEMREVRQVGHIGHQALHPRLERLLRIGAALRQAAVHFTGDLGQHPHRDARRRFACC